MREWISRLLRRKKIRFPRLTRPTYTDRHPGRTALIVGTGPSLTGSCQAIHAFIGERDALVLAANRAFVGVPKGVPCYGGFTNRRRLCQYGPEAAERGRLLIGTSIPRWIIRRLGTDEWERLPYVADDEAPFSVQDGIIRSGCGGVGPLLIATAAIMGCKEIWVAGMDGYPKGVSEHAYAESDRNEAGVLRHQEQTRQSLMGMRAWFKELGVSGPHFLTPSVYQGETP